ncbi:MAG: hypothetical protein ACTSPY_15835 [Candidatus Helarchaeota archaeon]
MEKSNVEIYETKLGEFRAVPTSNPEIFKIEKKIWSLNGTNWLNFGIMKWKEFIEFVKSNK